MRHRVEGVLATAAGFLVERLESPTYPQNFGALRCVGGAVETGETPETALVRELREEYDAVIEPAQLRLLSRAQGKHGPITRFEVRGHNLTPRRSKDGNENLIEQTVLPPHWTC